MNVDIRKADLSTDKERIISCLRMYLNPESDHKRFEWLYLSCPDGKAMVWLATERESDKTIGAAAAFPRRIYIGPSEPQDTVRSLDHFFLAILPKRS